MAAVICCGVVWDDEVSRCTVGWEKKCSLSVILQSTVIKSFSGVDGWSLGRALCRKQVWGCLVSSQIAPAAQLTHSLLVLALFDFAHSLSIKSLSKEDFYLISSFYCHTSKLQMHQFMMVFLSILQTSIPVHPVPSPSPLAFRRINKGPALPR